jgi:hypothetical protein
VAVGVQNIVLIDLQILDARRAVLCPIEMSVGRSGEEDTQHVVEGLLGSDVLAGRRRLILTRTSFQCRASRKPGGKLSSGQNSWIAPRVRRHRFNRSHCQWVCCHYAIILRRLGVWPQRFARKIVHDLQRRSLSCPRSGWIERKTRRKRQRESNIAEDSSVIVDRRLPLLDKRLVRPVVRRIVVERFQESRPLLRLSEPQFSLGPLNGTTLHPS